MKRILCLIALVPLVGISLRAQETSKTAAASGAVGAIVEAKIRQMWQDFKNKNKTGFAAALTDDDTAVWADGKGARDKAAATKGLDDWNVSNYSLSNFKVTSLGATAALATYRAKIAAITGGQNVNATLDVTEVFVKRGNDWKELRYQETEVN